MGGAVAVGALELQHDLTGWIALEPFVGDGRAGDIASVLWEEPPAHYGGAYSKMLVRPEPCGSKILDYRVSVYQPKAYVAPHRHRIQEQIYHVLDGEALMEIGGERTVVRKDDVIFIPPVWSTRFTTPAWSICASSR
jgi:mannose-6-phosphate isomerase-like protein (cupin superfamily)